MPTVPDEDAPVPIGTFARAARLTVKALRHYHARGVLVPAAVDPRTGYRYYLWEQLADALCVTTLRDLGVPLDRIKAHLTGGTPLHEVLLAEQVRLRRQVARAERALAVVEALRDAPALPVVEPELVEWEERTTLVLTGPAHADTIGGDSTALIERLLDVARGLGLDTGAPVLGEYPLTLTGTITVRARLEVDAPVSGGEARYERLAAGPVARVVHTGPFESLPLAYRGLLRWLGAHRHPATGPVYERYLDDPETTPPHLLRTEVLHRIAG